MDYDDKVLALAEFLKVDPALIENNYSQYYTVNERTVKRGKTPEDFKKIAEDFRKLLSDEMAELVTDVIINPYPPEKVDEAYKTVEEYLAPIGEKAERRKEQLKRLNFAPKETVEDIYNRLKDDNMYVSNVLYHLIKNREDRWNQEYCDSLRRAWLGQPVSDTRKDETVNDGEYLVMTDDEADDWEREGLEQLFDDMVDIPSHLEGYVDKDKWVDDHAGNRGENISGYDGEEHEVNFEGNTFYIYRHN